MDENELTRESVSLSDSEEDGGNLVAQMNCHLYTGTYRRKIKKQL
jgi:hypothetical protein